MDSGADGGEIRSGQKLFGRRGARQAEYFNRQLGNNRPGLWPFALKTAVRNVTLPDLFALGPN